MAPWDSDNRMAWVLGLIVAVLVALVAYGAARANHPVAAGAATAVSMAPAGNPLA